MSDVIPIVLLLDVSCIESLTFLGSDNRMYGVRSRLRILHEFAGESR